MSQKLFITLLLALLVLGGAKSSIAQHEPSEWLEIPVVRKTAQIAVESGTALVLTPSDLNSTMEVVAVNGEWLRVHGDRRSGWIQKRDVVPWDQPAAFHPTLLPDRQGEAWEWNQRGLALLREGAHDQAIDACTTALKLNPNLLLAYNNRGLAWEAKGEHDIARADYSAALRLNERLAVVHDNRGFAAFKKGDYAAAIADFQRALYWDSRLVSVQLHQALVWAAKQEYNVVIAYCNEAIRLDPHNAPAYRQRSEAWQAKGEYERAEKDMEKSQQLEARATSLSLRTR